MVMALPMPRAVCTNCRLVEGPTHLPVAFYACDKCGHVWTQEKTDHHTAKKNVAQSVMRFRVVQLWGPDNARQGTAQSEHKTIAEAFAALDSIATDVIPTVCDHLQTLGYRIVSRCTTTDQGIDIVAEHLTGAERLLIEAKGGTSAREGSARFDKGFNTSQVRHQVAHGFYTAASLYTSITATLWLSHFPTRRPSAPTCSRLKLLDRQ